MEGIANINKPAGMTSHQVVSTLRKVTGQQRIGHAGTLDPAAEGVLLVCIGSATRLAEYLMAGSKIYCAEVCLGVSTDTYDGEGRVTMISSVVGVTTDHLIKVLNDYVGQVFQNPPTYSAIKRDGIPLYRLARQGHEVQTQPRLATIFEIILVDWCLPLARILVRCAAGTYIRSLAHDIGLQLGCGAHLSHLVRLSSGRFTIEESVELKEMVNAITNGYWDQYVYPPDEAVLDMKAVLINEEQVRRLSHGLSWPAKHFDGDVQLARAYDANGKLLGLARRRKSNWWPYKVLV